MAARYSARRGHVQQAEHLALGRGRARAQRREAFIAIQGHEHALPRQRGARTQARSPALRRRGSSSSAGRRAHREVPRRSPPAWKDSAGSGGIVALVQGALEQRLAQAVGTAVGQAHELLGA